MGEICENYRLSISLVSFRTSNRFYVKIGLRSIKGAALLKDTLIVWLHESITFSEACLDGGHQRMICIYSFKMPTFIFCIYQLSSYIV